MTTRSEATQAACPLDCKVMPHTLLHGDCLGLMAQIPDGSVDMILCDLPYGTTACKWDTVIPFEPLWAEYKRIIKKNGAIVLFGSQPFTSALVMSNPKAFRYQWVWDKKKPGSCTRAKYGPLKSHEDILCFSFDTHNYYPIMEKRDKVKKRTTFSASDSCPVKYHDGLDREYTDKYPKSILSEFSNASQRDRFHPTQKPVALCEYLIKTYTNEGDTVLDNCMGSGTTGVACQNTARNFIGIEKDQKYFEIARDRIMGHNA